MKVLDLFSGIGGFSLGLEHAGMETVAFCEIEKFPQKVLKKHWPEVPIYDDIRKLTREQLTKDGIGTIDVVCGGFPCQPFSQAGKQEGFDDDRDLWPEMFRVIQEVRPRWVIGENVAGFVSMGLDRTLADLEGAGYRTEQIIIPACAVGALHRRDRVWLVGNASVMFSDVSNDQPKRKISQSGNNGSKGGAEIKAMAHANGARSQGEPITRSDGDDRPEPSNKYLGRCDWGGQHHWKVEPSVGRVANGVPNRTHRLKGLGNAVVPQIPEIIGRCIMEIEAKEK